MDSFSQATVTIDDLLVHSLRVIASVFVIVMVPNQAKILSKQ